MTSPKNSSPIHYKFAIFPVFSPLPFPRSDPSTLLECVPFSELGKIQPFTVTVTSSTALTVVGFHSHLTDSEVVGYLAGRWDLNTHGEMAGAVTGCLEVRCLIAI